MFAIHNRTIFDLKAQVFHALSDASRLKILESLRHEELTVGEIVQKSGLSQSNVSNHLACLRDCGLVISSQRGKYVQYRISDPRVYELLNLAESLLADVARGMYECTHYRMEQPPHE